MDTGQLFLLIAVAMGLVLFLDLLSPIIRPHCFTEPMIALTVGVLLGPAPGFGVLDLSAIGNPKTILLHGAQLTLAIGLMGVGLRIPPNYPWRFRRTLVVLLFLGMPLMWLSASLLAFATLGVPVLVALLIGAVITPTDPIVSTSIVTGQTAEECLTQRLRNAISAESGFNDGLVLPFVALAILLLSGITGGDLAGKWFGEAWLMKTFVSLLLGGAFGYGAAKLLHIAKRHEILEVDSFLSYAVALSLLTLAVAELIGGNGILAVFVAGLGFSAKAAVKERSQEENVQEAVNRLFTLPIFLLLGLAIPWEAWRETGWAAVAFVVVVLLLRRIPVWLLLSPITPGLRLREMVFSGWFGPVGIAALYYALHAEKETGNMQIWPMTSLVICASVFAHGITSGPFSRMLKRRAEKDWKRRR